MLGTALYSVMYTYHGKSSHAGWKPWMGRSAGDAVELLHAGTERMREHLPPASRIHWVTTFGGNTPNTVPEKASTWYYLRGLDEDIESMVNWLESCARGASMMTQTTYETRVLSAVHQRFYNQTLARLLYNNMEKVGKPIYTAEENRFALDLQKESGLPETGMEYPIALINAEDDELRASSSDMGDVCLVVPTGQISIPVWVPGVPAHNWAAAASGSTSIAHKGISAAAKAIVLTITDLLADQGGIEQVKEEFEQLKKKRPYRSFLPPNAVPPFGFYSKMMEEYREQLQTLGDSCLSDRQ